MIADIILSATLIANAGAILNFKLTKKQPDIDSFEQVDQNANKESLAERFREFLLNLRYLRIFIGVWNLVVIFLMLVYVIVSLLWQ
ncbi:hypothetical protein CAOG_01924 [Capsaspora owczarzaki ATCC 30864]|uniref:hypothetical protein n=1 Tax=Capsaspora owczarzaki (strain ATCC 30864) TaxID=595528 RepID=UPI0001FE5E26|nr:hypothetical protein CAOG_01924 [Capsaspora owczarzaki ATCC 30864]|eukprot:XP_004364792.1 hypothetical protein CAOG_01924 [Capsaspora owczarzaki ATCC 30864]